MTDVASVVGKAEVGNSEIVDEAEMVTEFVDVAEKELTVETAAVNVALVAEVVESETVDD